MENTRKIKYNIVFIIICFFSCNSQSKYVIIRNNDLIVKDSTNGLVLRLPSYMSKEKYFYLKTLRNHNEKIIKISEFIDVTTFDYIYNYPEDKSKINNEYYIKNPVDNYFKDSKHLYIYQYLNGNPDFFIAGNNSDYKILGGAYIRIEDKIYWRGEEVEGVDINSFKTLNVLRNNSEWKATIGMDKYHLYNGNSIMTRDIAISRYIIDNNIFEKYF